MDFKKLFIGGIVGGILYFGLSYLIYGKLMMTFFANHPGEVSVERAEADLQFLYLGLGSLLQGFFLAYIFVRANVSSAMSGFITGGVVALLMSAAMNCIAYGHTRMVSKTGMAADVVIATVMTAVIGAIVAMVMGMGKKAA